MAASFDSAQHSDKGFALERLARDAVQIELSDIPATAVEHAKLVIADTLAVILAGARSDEFVRLTTDSGDGLPLPPGRSQLATPGLRQTDPATAALVNASAGTVVEMDEFLSGGGAGGHAAIHVLPAALAVAQELGRSGSDLLAAVISGYEVAGRLFRSYVFDPLVQPHGHLGAVGAAVAVARLLGKDPAEPALVASAMPLLTLWEPSFEGATVHHTYAGMGSAVGILANKLAACGFTGSRRALDIAFGQVAGQRAIGAKLDAEVDPEHLLVIDDFVKLWPCCGRAYPAIAALQSMPEIDLSSIDSIDVQIDPLGMKLARQPENNALSTKFSIEYAVATYLTHAGFDDPNAFVPNSETFELSRRITVRGSDEFEANSAIGNRGARVTITDRNGAHTSVSSGSQGLASDPLPREALRQKFISLVAPDHSQTAETLYERLLKLDSLQSVHTLLTAGD